MAKVLLLAALVGTASAFAPASTQRSTTVLNDAKGLLGGEGPEPVPFGTKGSYWDPFGFTTKSPEWVLWFRESELKHGRAAMLAAAGLVVPEFVRIPGEAYSFEAIPRVVDAHDALPQSMIQIFLWISFLETVSWPALANMNNFDRQPGNFGFDPLGLYPTTKEGQEKYQISELKNGRLAMIAVGGMVTASVATGHGFPYL